MNQTVKAVIGAVIGLGVGEAVMVVGVWVFTPKPIEQPIPPYNPYIQQRSADTNPCPNGQLYTEWCGCQGPHYGSDC